MKPFTVFLFRAPDCRRGWLAYLRAEHARDATFHVQVISDTGAHAKNRAIVLANQRLKGASVDHDFIITHRNFDDWVFGIDLFPELKNFQRKLILKTQEKIYA